MIGPTLNCRPNGPKISNVTRHDTGMTTKLRLQQRDKKEKAIENDKAPNMPTLLTNVITR